MKNSALLLKLINCIDPKDYYAVIPYKDINKLFDLLNKHVNEPIKHDVPQTYQHKEKEKPKKKKKEKPKTTVTTFRQKANNNCEMETI